MALSHLPKDFVARAKAVTAKRAKTVIDHILKHGSITTEDLKEKYGYNHPPHAARDVREQGIPLETFTQIGKDGRSMAAYRFDLTTKVDSNKLGGRKAFPKVIKDGLLDRNGPRCAICGLTYETRYLQVDHCVPYEVAGESLSDELDQLMLVCGSCNRAKSWSCEHCQNWLDAKEIETCQGCYWANPKNYQHMALVQIRRVDLGWTADEVKVYDKLRAASKKQGLAIQEFLKKLAQDSLK